MGALAARRHGAMCYTISMRDIHPILYGVSDYAELRKANVWFVDRTATAFWRRKCSLRL